MAFYVLGRIVKNRTLKYIIIPELFLFFEPFYVSLRKYFFIKLNKNAYDLQDY